MPAFQPIHCTRCGLRLKQVEKDLYFDTCQACINYKAEVEARRTRLQAEVRAYHEATLAFSSRLG